MWDRRLRRAQAVRGDHRRWPAEARVPRLRLGRDRGGGPVRPRREARQGEAAEPGGGPEGGAGPGLHRDRPHPLGHPRPPLRRERAPALLRRRGGRPQRDHREPPRAQGGALRARPPVRVGDGHRDLRPPHRGRAPGERARSAARRPGRARAGLRDVRHRGGRRQAAGRDRCREERLPARGRLRHGRELPRVRRSRHPRAHARGELPRGRRAGRPHRAGDLDPGPRRRAGAAQASPDRVERGGRREGRPQALHAQGDLRAAASGRGHHPRSGVARAGRRGPRRRRAAGGVCALARARRHRRLRHLVARRPLRAAHDRVARARAGRGGARERVPEPRSARVAERPLPGRVAVRRDRRHARGGEGREGARRAGVRHLQRRGVRHLARVRRRDPPHPRRPRDRRRLDEGVHDAARRAVPARGEARAPAGNAHRRGGPRAPRGAPAHPFRDGADDPAGGRPHADREALRGARATSCSSGAGRSTRWRSRARSS